MAAPEARLWVDTATGQAVLHGLIDPEANKRAAVYREWSEEHGGGDVFEVMHEPTGFPNRTDTSISFNNGNRTLTVAPTGASFDIYIKGDKYTFTVSQTKQITDTEGTWWFYFDTSGVLTAAQTAPDLRDTAWTAIIYWDATNSVALDLAEERHGTTMDGATHSLLHYTVGTRWESGLAAGDYTIAGDGSADADAQLSIADGIIDDEDLPVIITDDSPQNLAPIAWIPVYYLLGATPVWRKTGADAFPVIDNATDEIRYNLDTAGTWSNAIATNNYHVAMWIFATPNVAEPIIAVLGQRQDSKLGDAKENNLYESLVFNTLPFREMKLLFRLIFNTRYPQHSNTPHCKLVDIVDLRSVSNLPSGTYVATAHSSLTGRSDRYSHPASAISLDLTNLDHLLSGLVAPTTDDVQHALEVMDDILANTQTVEADWTWSDSNKIYFNDTDIFIYSPADSILELSADGHVRIGSGAQDHLTGTADSLLVSGKFEVDSTAYFDNGIELYGQAIIYNATNSRLQFYETAIGDGLVAEMRYDTDQALLAVGAPLGRQIIVSDAANYTKDYDHAVQTNPTFYVHSATDPDSANDEYIYMTFPVTYAEIGWGSGELRLTGGDVLVPSSGKLYFDAGAAIGTEWAGSLNDMYLDLAHGAGGGLRIRDEDNLLLTIRRVGAGAVASRAMVYTSDYLYLDGNPLIFQAGGTWIATGGSSAFDFRKPVRLLIDGTYLLLANDYTGVSKHAVILGTGWDVKLGFNGDDMVYYATGITATAKHLFGLTGTEETVAGKYHVTAAGTEYAGSDAAGYYDIHALTAARFNADIFMVDAKNIILDTTTGTELGTAAAQKLGFWGATPVVQPVHVADPDGTLASVTQVAKDILAQMAATGMQAAA